MLSSYKKTNKDIPFCIITDKGNPYASLFDKIVIIDNPFNSYLDKLKVYKYLPYERNIIIDADSLVLDDISFYFEKFKNATPVSSKGIIADKDSADGWFTASNVGKYKKDISYSIRLHGGIYYVEKSVLAEAVYEKAAEIQENYDTIKFNFFTKPSDEAIMALAMAIYDCKPITFAPEEFIYYPQFASELQFDPAHRKISLNQKNVKLMHWSTGKTLRFHLYKKYVAYFNQKFVGKKNYILEFRYFIYKYLHQLYGILKKY